MKHDSGVVVRSNVLRGTEKVRKYEVVLTVRVHASRQDVLDYVTQALAAWGNGHPKESPFFNDNKKISVHSCREFKRRFIGADKWAKDKERGRQPTFSPEIVREVRNAYKRRRIKSVTQRELAARYDTSIATIHHMIHGTGAYSDDALMRYFSKVP